jgi:acetyl-CoA carboxylase biotin carboxyl carrier protein
MWQDKLKEIIYILENSDINEIEVTFWGKKIRVLKNSPNITTDSSDEISNTKNIKSSSSDNVENQNYNKKKGATILSPMPGVYYSAQSSDKPPYVSKGDTVKIGQVLCIIESMKIMNEIESEHNGVIKKILVNNSDPVEFNQPLYVIEPSE